jgi:hypothetical protein
LSSSLTVHSLPLIPVYLLLEVQDGALS